MIFTPQVSFRDPIREDKCQEFSSDNQSIIIASQNICAGDKL